MIEYRKRRVQVGNSPDSVDAIINVYICDVCGDEITDAYYRINDMDICDHCYDTAELRTPENTYYPSEETI